MKITIASIKRRLKHEIDKCYQEIHRVPSLLSGEEYAYTIERKLAYERVYCELENIGKSSKHSGF